MNDQAPAEAAPQKRDYVLKPSLVKSYALTVSRAKRAGKFERVATSFVVGCQAEFEGKLRSLANTLAVQDMPKPPGKLVTGFAKQKFEEKLEELAIAIIHGRVMRHPTVGVTLMD